VIYLSGHHGPLLSEAARAYPVGLILQPKVRYQWHIPEYSAGWAADNGCFADGPNFDAGNWLKWLIVTVSRYTANCHFATAPDVVGDGAATLKRSRPHFETIRKLGYPAALCGQEGTEKLRLPWDDFDCLFLDGATTEWKIGPAAADLVGEAKARGKWAHMGRVNSAKRLRIARDMGCDSADGNFVGRAPTENVPRLIAWFHKLEGIA
jgi:hypothetical protein